MIINLYLRQLIPSHNNFQMPWKCGVLDCSIADLIENGFLTIWFMVLELLVKQISVKKLNLSQSLQIKTLIY